MEKYFVKSVGTLKDKFSLIKAFVTSSCKISPQVSTNGTIVFGE